MVQIWLKRHKINIVVKKGDFLAIMGPSVAGKSTLLYILGCLDRPTSGEYIFSGKKVSNFVDHELSFIRSTKIGFVFQTFNLLHHYTVLENVKIPFLYNNTEEKDGHPRAIDAIKSVNLMDLMAHNPEVANKAHRKLRSILSMLGVVFGIISIMTMLSVGEGAKRVEKYIELI